MVGGNGGNAVKVTAEHHPPVPTAVASARAHRCAASRCDKPTPGAILGRRDAGTRGVPLWDAGHWKAMGCTTHGE